MLVFLSLFLSSSSSSFWRLGTSAFYVIRKTEKKTQESQTVSTDHERILFEMQKTCDTDKNPCHLENQMNTCRYLNHRRELNLRQIQIMNNNFYHYYFPLLFVKTSFTPFIIARFNYIVTSCRRHL